VCLTLALAAHDREEPWALLLLLHAAAALRHPCWLLEEAFLLLFLGTVAELRMPCNDDDDDVSWYPCSCALKLLKGSAGRKSGGQALMGHTSPYVPKLSRRG
jgi:hypothetical protein